MSMTNGNGYAAFLERKLRIQQPAGFDVKPEHLCPSLFDWQRDIARWCCRVGRVGAFLDTGLGKSLIALAWGEQIVRQFGDMLILTPLAVAQQFRREAEKFGIGVDVTVCREARDVRPGINVTNYERLEKFDLSRFVAVDADEGSILKAYTGKTKQALCRSFAGYRFKMSATATPSPNDHLEIGNQADFLSVMPSNEMISRWFINDTMQAGNYRLKHHAESDFWRWVSSWAACVTHPRDLGYDDTRYDLPPLRRHIHVVSDAGCPPPSGFLFHTGNVSATNMHGVKRATNAARADRVAEIVSADASGEPWLIWCDTNYEADELRRRLPEAVEVRGNDSLDVKEERLIGFSSGAIKQLITKPEIAGHGLNWQHCNRMIFAGLSFSMERLYQAVRRCWRFGQEREVNVHLVTTEAEGQILKTLETKQRAFAEMQDALRDAIREHQLESIYGRAELRRTIGHHETRIPQWLRSKAAS